MTYARLPAVILGVGPAEKGAAPWSEDSASGQKLGRLAGLEHRVLRMRFALDNLCTKFEPTREDLSRAALRYQFVDGFRYILAGTEVLRALGKRALPRVEPGELPWHGTRQAPPLVWYFSRENIVMAVLPHPSGRNRWYNDKRCVLAAEKFLDLAQFKDGHATNRWESARHQLVQRARATT